MNFVERQVFVIGEIDHCFHVDKKGWDSKSRADGRCNGSRVKHIRKNS